MGDPFISVQELSGEFRETVLPSRRTEVAFNSSHASLTVRLLPLANARPISASCSLVMFTNSPRGQVGRPAEMGSHGASENLICVFMGVILFCLVFSCWFRSSLP